MEKPCITGLCVLMRSLGNSELVPGSHEARGSIPLSSTKKIKGLARYRLSPFLYVAVLSRYSPAFVNSPYNKRPRIAPRSFGIFMEALIYYNLFSVASIKIPGLLPDFSCRTIRCRSDNLLTNCPFPPVSMKHACVVEFFSPGTTICLSPYLLLF